MAHLYHLIGETAHREIEWCYDTPSGAYRAWRHMKATGTTPDDGCDLIRASLWRDGQLREKWYASAQVIPIRREG